MKIYNYDKSTGEYRGESEAKRSPEDVEEVYLFPASSTDIKPIVPEKGFAAVFNGTAWSEVEDFRGQTYYDEETRQPVVIDIIGSIPQGLVPTQPPVPPPSKDELRVSKLKAALGEAGLWTAIAALYADRSGASADADALTPVFAQVEDELG